MQKYKNNIEFPKSTALSNHIIIVDVVVVMIIIILRNL